MAICSFERIEKKYLMTKAQYQAFMTAAVDELAIDEYGLHTISNIYFDTLQDDLIRRSIEKPVYKEKMRLRSYGVPGEDSPVFLEIKKKFKGVVYKRRVQMTLKEARAYLQEDVLPADQGQIMQEIDYFRRFYGVVPRQFIAYDRIAMFGLNDKSIRLTIDQNIRERKGDLALEHGSYGRRILPQDYYLMEIKVPGAVPLWMVRILDELKIYPVSFSKYGEAYKQKMHFMYSQNQLLRRAAAR